jgi:hypothetical protein
MMLLWRVETLRGWRQALVTGLALGVLFTGYDLLPFFGVAGVLLLLRRRLWGTCAVFTVAQWIPTVLAAAVLWKVFRVPFRNGNTEVYFAVLRSYVSPVDLWAWWYWLRQFPQAVVANTFFSNFLFLPLLFLLVLFAALWLPRESRAVLRPAEAWLLIAAGLLFLFNNLAPPYTGWPLRGSWVPRLYQPVFVALVSTLAAFYARVSLLPRALRRGAWAALGLVVALQAWVVFAPVLGAARLSGWLYYRFYEHAPRPVYADNLQKLGTRPVGFCAFSAIPQQPP